MKKIFFFMTVIMTISLLAVPSSFSLISPINSANDIDVWPLLQWEESTDTTMVTYNVYVSLSAQFYPEDTVVYENISATSYRPEKDLVIGNQYRWKVEAVNENNEKTWAQTPGSAFGYWRFYTINASSPRNLISTSPLPSNRTIIKENNPYTIDQGNLTIPTGKWLEITEGVVLEFTGDNYIYVQGELRVIGVAGDEVLITTSNEIPQPGAWEDIRFADSAVDAVFDESGNYISGCILQYAKFEYAGSVNPLIHAPNSNVFIDNCTLDKSSNKGGIYIVSTGARITNNYINGFTSNARGGGIFSVGNYSVINNNTVRGCTSSYSSSYSSTTFSYGGGIYSSGSNCYLENNIISECTATNSTSSSYSTTYSNGGGIYLGGSNCYLKNNTVSECTAISSSSTYSYSTTYSYGGGIYLSGSNCYLENNTVSGCSSYSSNPNYSTSNSNSLGGGIYTSGDSNSLKHNTIESNQTLTPSGYVKRRKGAGIYISGSNITYSDNIVKNNNSNGGDGGGIYVDLAGAHILNCVFNSNLSGNGGGIFVNQDNVIIEKCTVTSNTATVEGGGIYGGQRIKSSIIKYNTCTNSNNAGGIFANAHTDSINNNDVSKNSYYHIKHSSTNDIDAKYNWWFTRSYGPEIGDVIWDGYDTTDSLGFVNCYPIAGDVPSSVPGIFTQVEYIGAKNDSTYSEPLTRSLTVGDTMFVEVSGIDSNPYNRDVTVVYVGNYMNYEEIRPYFEETGENTGVFRGKIYFDIKTAFPDSIEVSNGDSLVFISEADPEFGFSYIIGSTPITAAPAIPANITTTQIEGDILIDWDDSENASSYDIYYSSTPYGEFELLTNAAVSQYTYTPVAGMKYFYIVAKNSSKGSKNNLKIEKLSRLKK
jgi:parallel beta-helix repeat protein/predicted outer membrane repeat protein